MDIGPARIFEYNALCDIYKTALEQHIDHISPAQFERARTEILQAIIGEDERVYVARGENEVPLGFVVCGTVLELLAPKTITGEIYRLYVLPDTWGQGIGAKLIDMALLELKRRGHDECLAWAPEKSVSWYTEHGWKALDITRPDLDRAPIMRTLVSYTFTQAES